MVLVHGTSLSNLNAFGHSRTRRSRVAGRNVSCRPPGTRRLDRSVRSTTGSAPPKPSTSYPAHHSQVGVHPSLTPRPAEPITAAEPTSASEPTPQDRPRRQGR
ncbi:hypothetical protein ACFFX0_16600 [Citricoccus parietis]|uniref:Uncharacterized protein n=1 Tax=Citricoccus parietis TaxID=592307 RepID=A0ABV5G1B4_9MICC